MKKKVLLIISLFIIVISVSFIAINKAQSPKALLHNNLIFIDSISKVYFIDKTGKRIIKDAYDVGTSNFSDGLACCNKNNKYGYIDKTGKIVIPFIFDAAKPFSCDRAIVLKEGVWYYIDKTGKKVGNISSDIMTHVSGNVANDFTRLKKGTILKDFVNNHAIFMQNFEPTLIDKDCNIVLDKEYTIYNVNLNNNTYIIESRIKDKFSNKHYIKYGFIDGNGEVIIKPSYDSVRNFSNGLAVVSKNNKWGVIDKSNQIIIPIKYLDIKDYSDGLISVLEYKDKEFLWGYIDKNGNQKISSKYNYVTSVSEDRAFAQYNREVFCIDKSGKVIFKTDCLPDTLYNSGVIIIHNNIKKKYDLIDKSGYVLAEYDFIVPTISEPAFKSGFSRLFPTNRFCLVVSNKKVGVINNKGVIIIPIIYDIISDQFSENTIVAIKDKKVEYYNYSGKKILETNYSYSSNFINGIATVMDRNIFNVFR